MIFLDPAHPGLETLPQTVVRPLHLAEVPRLRLGVLNLMPKMEETELDLLRCLLESAHPLELVWLRVATRQRSGARNDLSYVDRFYQTIEEATRERGLDGLIVTGAPIEELPFHNVTYWSEMQQIIRYAHQAVPSTLYLCWGAMAAAYELYEIDKIGYAQKLSGLFPHHNVHGTANPFSQGIGASLNICQSRHTGIDLTTLDAQIRAGKLVSLFRSDYRAQILDNEAVGTTVFASSDHRAVFNLGHLEYHAGTIRDEVVRDLGKTPPVHYPVENYFTEPTQHSGLPEASWLPASTRFFANFIDVIAQKRGLQTVSQGSSFVLHRPAAEERLTTPPEQAIAI